MVESLCKIQKFQEEQKKAYVQKHHGFRKKYHEYKKKYIGLMEYKKKRMEAVRREKIFIAKLKEAYQ